MKTNIVRIRVERIDRGFKKIFPVLNGQPITNSEFLVNINGEMEACIANTEDQRILGISTIAIDGYFIKSSDGEKIKIEEGMEAIPI
ncbi:hypothetical protein ACFL2R_01045 [Patescibacteria group bacterium]